MRGWAALLGLVIGTATAIADDGRPFFLARPDLELRADEIHSPPLPPVELLTRPQAYPYGWFGAAPRRHWSRQVGLYRNYTQWTAR